MYQKREHASRAFDRRFLYDATSEKRHVTSEIANLSDRRISIGNANNMLVPSYAGKIRRLKASRALIFVASFSWYELLKCCIWNALFERLKIIAKIMMVEK